MKVNFIKEPDLWPESHTDFFTFCETASAKEVEECITDACGKINGATAYQQINTHQFASSDQIFVEELSDSAYGCEIPVRHTHIPKSFGETARFNEAMSEVFSDAEIKPA